jgi:hypothetical protein
VRRLSAPACSMRISRSGYAVTLVQARDLPLSQGDHGLSAKAGDDGRPRLLPQCDPRRVGEDSAAQDQRLLKQPP